MSTFDDVVSGKGVVRHFPTGMTIKEASPLVRCNDGTTLSVQASSNHYCEPRTDRGPYTSVEVMLKTDERPESWEDYYSDPIYGYIPVELVREFIESHGGEQGAEPNVVKKRRTRATPQRIRKDETFGSPEIAIKAAEHFRKKLNYEKVQPVQFTVMSPGKQNRVTCYGLLYNRPEFRGEDWLYLLINLEDLKSVYSRTHYYRLNGQDWYIAGYSTESSLQPQYARYHPFGHNVGMTAWRSAFDLDDVSFRRAAEPHPRLQIILSSIHTNEVIS